MRSVLICASITVSVFLCSAINLDAPSQQNQPPVVKIIAPKANGAFEWDSQVNYQISVSDKEDGDSKYDEINAMEVLLEVRYTGKAGMPAILNKTVQPDAPGLAVMRTSNCFNCHNFNAKSIGPSFHDISSKYPATATNIELMVKHIKEGSAGIWGKVSMPTHPELTTEETRNTVKWLLKNSTDPDVNYYTGTAGSFRTRVPVTNKKGIYIITASYTDHGLKSNGANRLKGQDVVILTSR